MVSGKHLWYLLHAVLIHSVVIGAQLQLSIFSDAHWAFICMHATVLFGSLGLFRTTIFMESANRSCCTLSGTRRSWKKEDDRERNREMRDKSGRDREINWEREREREAEIPHRKVAGCWKKNNKSNGRERREQGSMGGETKRENENDREWDTEIEVEEGKRYLCVPWRNKEAKPWSLPWK